MNHERAQNLLFKAAMGKLSPRRFLALEPHLQSCAQCRSTYDSIARVEAQVAGGPQHFAPIQQARVKARLQQALRALPADEAEREAPGASIFPILQRRAVRMGLAMAAMLLIAILTWRIRPPPQHIAARGGAAPDGFTLLAYCVGPEGAQRASPQRPCQTSERLQLSYRAAAPLQQAQLKLQGPGDAREVSPGSLPASVGLRPLGASWELAQPGEYTATLRALHKGRAFIVEVKVQVRP